MARDNLCWLAETAGGKQRFPSEPSRFRRGEEDRDGSDVLRLADAAERRASLEILRQVAVGNTGSLEAFGFHRSGLMEFTRIFLAPSSLARTRVMVSTAALVAE